MIILSSWRRKLRISSCTTLNSYFQMSVTTIFTHLICNWPCLRSLTCVAFLFSFNSATSWSKDQANNQHIRECPPHTLISDHNQGSGKKLNKQIQIPNSQKKCSSHMRYWGIEEVSHPNQSLIFNLNDFWEMSGDHIIILFRIFVSTAGALVVITV